MEHLKKHNYVISNIDCSFIKDVFGHSEEKLLLNE